ADWGTTSAPAPNGTGPLPTPGSYSGPNTLLGMGAPGSMGPGGMYGLNPGLRKMFKPGYGGCTGPGCGAGKGGYPGYPGYGGYGGYGAQPPVMQGTLVFPHHPFARSPRDFFMYEPNR